MNVNPVETIILEDGPGAKPAWIDSMFPRLGRVRWINNEYRMGQSYSIDRLYGEVKTELVFHCEDDWLFHEGNFLSKSYAILNQHKDISMVALRSDWNHPLTDDSRGFKIAEPYWGGVWGGTCWNPGLRRLSDFKRFGSYGRHVGYGTHGLGHEKTWSKLHLDAGFRIATLPHHCYHIGGECSRSIEPLEMRLPKILIAVLACKNFDYGRWESADSPHYDPKHEAYCKDIHISGPNSRIEALRDTWFKDIEPFAHHVEARLFYGDDLGVPDDYEHLPHKTQAICKWALEHGFDFLFKCDDDTAVYVDRLVREVLERRFIDYGGYVAGEMCTGGPGYWLSKRAMQAVVASGSPVHWAEDVNTGIALAQKNFYPQHLSGHTPGFSDHWIWPKGFDASKLNSEIVTLHAVQPEVMREWYANKG